MESGKLVKGVFILTIAGLISKVLSASYRIPLQNLTGDIGFYVYQQVYPILGMAFILTLYGFPSAISKLVAEKQQRSYSFQRFYLPLFFILFTVNGMIFLVLYVTAPLLATWVGDERLVSAYQTAAFIFLLIPFTSLLRGVFQGERDIQPTAFSQMGEQLFRVIIIIVAAVFVSLYSKDIYVIGTSAGIASITGALIAIIILSCYFLQRKPIHFQQNDEPIPWGHYIRMVVMFGFIASLNHMVLLVIQFADTFTLVPGLLDFGLTQFESMEAKGIFDRGQPLIQLGTVLGSSFALALIPVISKERLNVDTNSLYEDVQSSFLFSFYLSIGATIGLIVIFPQTNLLLFQDMSGTASLRILVIAIFLCSISITGASILQGLGYMKSTAGFISLALLLKWILNQWLIPHIGIIGSAIATVVSLSVLCFFVLWLLHRQLRGLKLWKNVNWSALFIANVSMVVYLFIINWLGPDYTTISRLGLLIYVLILVIGGGLLYCYMLIRFRAFSQKEISMLPFASKLQHLFKEGE